MPANLSFFVRSSGSTCLRGGRLGSADTADGAVVILAVVAAFPGISSYRPSLPPYSGFITMHFWTECSSFSYNREEY